MKKSRQEWSRRKFINTIAGTGGILLSSPAWSWAAEEADPRVAAIVGRTMGIDTHNHVDVPLKVDELPGPKIDLTGELKNSGFAAICMTFAVDYQILNHPGEAYERFQNGMHAMDKVLEINHIKRALNLNDLLNARKRNAPTVIQSLEGAHFLEGKLNRLGIAYGKGLRHLGLFHDSDASVALGDVYTNEPKYGGLTYFGVEVIRECNKLGILVDLTHASNDTVDLGLRTSSRPVLISHTGLDTRLGQNERMAKMMLPRLISVKQAKMVADSGGVLGVWTHLAGSPLEYAQNVRAMVEVVGIDHVCIGTDTKLTPAYRSPGDSGPRPGGNPPDQRHDGPQQDKKDQNEAGEDKKPRRTGERTNECWPDQTVGFYYAIVDALLKTGFTEEEIGKIGGENFCRIFDAATRGH